jgi:hypothetical protein
VYHLKNKTNQADGSEGSNNGDEANVVEFPAGRPSGRHLLAGIALGSNGGRLSALSRIYKASGQAALSFAWSGLTRGIAGIARRLTFGLQGGTESNIARGLLGDLDNAGSLLTLASRAALRSAIRASRATSIACRAA